VQLSVDAARRAVTLSIRTQGEQARSYVLRDVEQGSSPGSGASHKADTVIRGRSGGTIFTLFASYDNDGADQDAALQVEGRTAVLLTCAGGQYRVGDAMPMNGLGLTNIYTLGWRSGWAHPMKLLPAEPELDSHR
jgi:hypothetical protein